MDFESRSQYLALHLSFMASGFKRVLPAVQLQWVLYGQNSLIIQRALFLPQPLPLRVPLP